MGYLDTYFAGSSQDYLDYFGEFSQSWFRYVLKWQPINGDPEDILLIKENPAGWDKLKIKLDRSKRYYTIFRNYVISLKFYKRDFGGGEFIETAFDIDDILTDITIEIWERNTQTNDHDLFYSGKLDFKPERIENLVTENFFEIGIKDGNKESKMIDREDVEYDLFSLISHDNNTITDFSSEQSIGLPPIEIFSQFKITGNINNETINVVPVNNVTPVTYPRQVSSIIINDVGSRLVTTDDNVILYQNSLEDDVIIDVVNLEVTSQNNGLVLTGAIFGNNAKVEIVHAIYIFDEEDVQVDAQLLDQYIHTFTQTGTGIVVVNPEFDFSPGERTFNVPAGGRLELSSYFLIYEGFVGWTIDYYQRIYFNMNAYENVPSIPQTDAHGLFFHEAFTRIVQLATGEVDTSKLFRSEILGKLNTNFENYSVDGKWSKLFLTSGFQVRNFPNKSLNASLKDLHQTMKSIDPAGFGFDRVNDRFYVIPFSECFNATDFMFDLGEIDEFSIVPYADAYCNSVLGGYPTIDFEDLNGASEFNNELEYTINQPVKNQLDLRAIYSGSSLSIEIPRRKQFSSYSSEDTKYDELRMVVYTDGNNAVQGGNANTNPSGIINIDQYYNIQITGRENMLRQGPLLLPMMWKIEQPVQFLKLKKSVNISYVNQNGLQVSEFDTIGIEELTGRIFVPALYKFTKDVNYNIMTRLLADAHGFFTFSKNNKNYSGFLKTLDVESYPKLASWEAIGRIYIGDLNYTFEDGNNYTFEDDNNYIFE